MTAAGLAEINGSAAVYGSDSIYSGYSECYIRITYAGTVNSDATVVYGDSGNPNEVVLEWRRTNTAYYDTLQDCCHLYVYVQEKYVLLELTDMTNALISYLLMQMVLLIF